MAKSATWANDLLKLVFTNAAAAKIGDAAGLQPSGAAGDLYVGLHTGDPTGGDQSTSEANYTGYARVAVARSAAGWTVTGAAVSNFASVTFGICTAGSNTITHFSVGTDLAGAGKLLYSFPLIAAYYDFTAKASSDTITAPGHTLVTHDTVQFVPVPGGVMPTGIAAGTTYFVKTVSGNDLTISTTDGGATLDITADGAALIGKISPLAVSLNITPVFSAGNLAVAEA